MFNPNRKATDELRRQLMGDAAAEYERKRLRAGIVTIVVAAGAVALLPVAFWPSMVVLLFALVRLAVAL